MSTLEVFQDVCQKSENNEWQIRILSELEYMNRFYRSKVLPIPAVMSEVISDLYATLTRQGALTREDVLQAEKRLAELSKDAKSLTMLCVSHSHIDMNWEWGTPETVSIVIDTFQTMLSLLEEYPDFIYSQSQAATYEIIEKYCPSLLPAIRKRVKEGRWELTASTWVEPDKNMLGTEAMARHILYTKRYLSNLFGVDPDSLEIDFEPDTFGHSANIPEVLSRGGVKYYYFCRGRKEGPTKVFRWRAASGSEILAYEEPYWYQTVAKPNAVLNLPRYAAENHTDVGMMIYGVGDHGGGPTRKDLNRIIDMATWPLFPTIRFSTLREFFHLLDQNREKYPVVQDELNCLYTGCYTSQAKIKRANRISEDRLYDAEVLGVFAKQVGDVDVAFPNYEKAWRGTLFNQFHDILPGSNSADSRDQAMGIFQESLSYCVGNANRAMRSLVAQITTDGFGGTASKSGTANGAGVGANTMKPDIYSKDADLVDFGFGTTSHADGKVRVFVLTNTTQYAREESVLLTIWDWPYSVRLTEIVDSYGNSLPFTVREENGKYWWHTYAKLLVHASVPAMGYSTIAVRYNPDMTPLPIAQPDNGQRPDEPIEWHSSFARHPVTSMRLNRIMDIPIVLENALVRAEFKSEDMTLVSFYDKRTNTQLIDRNRPSAFFRLISESDYYKRPAWRLGPYGHIEDLNQTCLIRVQEKNLEARDPFVHYEFQFGNSKVKTTISLAENSATLRFSIQVLWREFAEENVNTPLLQFHVPFAFEADTYRYDVPCGVVDRAAAGYDVPASLFAAPIPKEGSASLSLTSDCKYGYRGNYNSLSVSLLRGSYYPDPCQDIGTHTIELGLSAVQNVNSGEMTEYAVRFAHPVLAYSAPSHEGMLPPEGSFFQISPNARLISVKRSEKGENCYILRLHQGSEEPIRIGTMFEIQEASIADVLERSIEALPHDVHEVEFHAAMNTLQTVRIQIT